MNQEKNQRFNISVDRFIPNVLSISEILKWFIYSNQKRWYLKVRLWLSLTI